MLGMYLSMGGTVPLYLVKVLANRVNKAYERALLEKKGHKLVEVRVVVPESTAEFFAVRNKAGIEEAKKYPNA